MKRCVIAFLLLLVVYVAQIGAQDCRYLTNKVSGMDGSRLVITQPAMLSGNFSGGSLEIWSALSGDSAIIIAFTFYNKTVMSITRNDSITIELQNGEVIFVPVMQDAASVPGAENKLTILTLIRENTRLKLESAPFKNISIPVNIGVLKGSPANKKQAASIQKVISCVGGFLDKNKE